MSTWVGLADAEKEIDRLQARVASLADRIQTLYAENERLRERVEEAVREERVRLTELWQDRVDQERARVAALEEALGRIVNTYGVGLGTELLSEARAALARPTPTPDQRQYGKKCAHDGYVVAGCRDCEARATTPTPGEG